MYGYIYLTTNLINGKKYIGQHKSDKFEFHCYKGTGVALKEAFKKYGKENFETVLLPEINAVPTICDTPEQLNESEIYYIEYYNCKNSKEYYNLADGGWGHSWSALSEEARQLHSERTKNRSREWWDNATPKQLEARTAKWRNTWNSQSEEYKAELSKRNSEGQKRYLASLSEEDRLKLTQDKSERLRKLMHDPEKEKLRKEKEHITKSLKTEEDKNAYYEKQYAAQKGRKYFTNGIDIIKCKPEDAPEGYYPGGAHRNNYTHVCFYEGKQYNGLNLFIQYLVSQGYPKIPRDVILVNVLGSGTQKRLFKKYPELSTLIIKSREEVENGFIPS